MNVKTVTEKIKNYLLIQIDQVAENNSMISFTKPLITRIINNNIDKAEKSISLLADKDGNIDIETIATEMSDSIINTKAFTMHTSILGDVTIGDNKIVLNIPFTEKNIVFNREDIDKLRTYLKEN